MRYWDLTVYYFYHAAQDIIYGLLNTVVLMLYNTDKSKMAYRGRLNIEKSNMTLTFSPLSV